MTSKSNVDRYRQSVTDRLLIVEAQSKANGNVLNRLGENFEKFVQEITEWRGTIGRPNWPVIIGLISASIATVGILVVLLMASLSVFWFMINAQMSNAISPVKQDLSGAQAQIKINTSLLADNVIPTMATLVATSAESKQDRADIKIRFSELQAQVFTNVSNIRASTEKLKEVETQFHSNSQLRNVQFANQERENSRLNNALHALAAPLPQYPTAPFYTPDSPVQPRD